MHLWLGLQYQSPYFSKVALMSTPKGDCTATRYEHLQPQGHDQILEQLVNGGADVNAQGEQCASVFQRDAYKSWTPLHWAASHGHTKIINLLIRHGAEIERRNAHGQTALLVAAGEGQEEAVRTLLSFGANIMAVDARNRNVLHQACDRYQVSALLIQMLLDQDAVPTAADSDNMTPFHYAAYKSRTDIAGMLLRFGADVDITVRGDRSVPNQKLVKEASRGLETIEIQLGDDTPTICGLTPLHAAPFFGRADMVDFFLVHSAKPNISTLYGETPLHLALRLRLQGPILNDAWGDSFMKTIEDSATLVMEDPESEYEDVMADICDMRRRIVEILLGNVATDANARDRRLRTPLHAIPYDNRTYAWAANCLLFRGADVDARDAEGRTALHLAAAAGDVESVEVLLENRADVAQRDLEGRSVLLYATRSQNAEMISTLFQAQDSEKISLKDKDGLNALHYALDNGWSCTVELLRGLMDFKIGIEEPDTCGLSPLASYLHHSVLYHDLAVIEWVLNQGADVSYIDPNGLSLAHYAVKVHKLDLEVLKLLATHGVDLAAADLDGRTLLHHGGLSGSLNDNIIAYLLNEVGLNMDTMDFHGNTPLQYACRGVSKYQNRQLFRSSRWEETRETLLLFGADLSLVTDEPQEPESERSVSHFGKGVRTKKDWWTW
jgi:ankyrin repeat protein